MYIKDIEESLDNDGELAIIMRSYSCDEVVYIRDEDLRKIASVFGYSLVIMPTK